MMVGSKALTLPLTQTICDYRTALECICDYSREATIHTFTFTLQLQSSPWSFRNFKKRTVLI